MGLGALPASDKHFLGMLGMHGTYEANLVMHGCDLMLNIGARFDDRVTGLISGFSPNSQKIHCDIDPSSVNKNVQVDLAVNDEIGEIMQEMWVAIKKLLFQSIAAYLEEWRAQINNWRQRDLLASPQVTTHPY